MAPPPATLDGVKILYWTAAPDVPFYYLKDGDEVIAVTGYAVGRFDFSECFQLFTCDANWRVINDRDAVSLQEAVALAGAQARSHHLVWHQVK
jgi:hypothetical protein